MTIALLVAACGTSIDPVITFGPSPSRPRPTVAASVGPFVKSAYPATGAAPCGQAESPDASHAPYSGNLRRITAADAATVVFELCDPDVAFLAKIASPAFSINDAAWLASHIDPGVAGSQAIVREVNGTGPYRLDNWKRGSEISLGASDVYWGEPAKNERLIVRWQDDPAKRLIELQEGTVDGIDGVDPQSVAALTDDVDVSLAPRPSLDVFYIGFNNTFAPFDNEKVRQAIAMGIDRERIVASAFPPGSEVATHYTPCAVPHGCVGERWFEYDPTLAKETLAAAGYPDGFDTTIQYRPAARQYLPDPDRVASELQKELLTNLGIRAPLVPVPDTSFLADVDAGRLDGIHLLGQVATLPDVTAFLDPRFGPGASAEFGTKFDDIGKALVEGRASEIGGARDEAYTKANDAIRTHVPMIPVAHTASSAAFRADVPGGQASPVHLERLSPLMPGDRRQFVWLTTAEPPGLYCADETDMVAGLVCTQMMDSLYAYDPETLVPVPALAQSCAPNAELTRWTCKLRPRVIFHDGSALDANDVLVSFAVQWDADNPRHRGRDGTFRTFVSSFGGFLHAAARSGG